MSGKSPAATLNLPTSGKLTDGTEYKMRRLRTREAFEWIERTSGEKFSSLPGAAKLGAMAEVLNVPDVDALAVVLQTRKDNGEWTQATVATIDELDFADTAMLTDLFVQMHASVKEVFSQALVKAGVEMEEAGSKGSSPSSPNSSEPDSGASTKS